MREPLGAGRRVNRLVVGPPPHTLDGALPRDRAEVHVCNASPAVEVAPAGGASKYRHASMDVERARAHQTPREIENSGRRPRSAPTRELEREGRRVPPSRPPLPVGVLRERAMNAGRLSHPAHHLRPPPEVGGSRSAKSSLRLREGRAQMRSAPPRQLQVPSAESTRGSGSPSRRRAAPTPQEPPRGAMSCATCGSVGKALCQYSGMCMASRRAPSACRPSWRG